MGAAPPGYDGPETIVKLLQIRFGVDRFAAPS